MARARDEWRRFILKSNLRDNVEKSGRPGGSGMLVRTAKAGNSMAHKAKVCTCICTFARASTHLHVQGSVNGNWGVKLGHGLIN